MLGPAAPTPPPSAAEHDSLKENLGSNGAQPAAPAERSMKAGSSGSLSGSGSPDGKGLRKAGVGAPQDKGLHRVTPMPGSASGPSTPVTPGRRPALTSSSLGSVTEDGALGPSSLESEEEEEARAGAAGGAGGGPHSEHTSPAGASSPADSPAWSTGVAPLQNGGAAHAGPGPRAFSRLATGGPSSNGGSSSAFAQEAHARPGSDPPRGAPEGAREGLPGHQEEAAEEEEEAGGDVFEEDAELPVSRGHRSVSESGELLLPKKPGDVLARMAADAKAGAPTPLRISIDRGPSAALSYTGSVAQAVLPEVPVRDGAEWREDELAVARFLRTTPHLSKQVIGDLLGEPSERSLRVLAAFTRLFCFKGMSFEKAMRTYLESFRLPGEAQKIYRILDAWSQEYFAQAPGFFASADAVHVLAFSVVLLNTDQHKKVVKRKMTCEEFVHNNRGINGGASLPEAFLASLYEGIRHHAIPIPSASQFAPGGTGSGYFPPPSSGPPRRSPPKGAQPQPGGLDGGQAQSQQKRSGWARWLSCGGGSPARH